jgi:protein-S-isoprenylcysteine O-methyltransferase Ste14
MRISFEDSRPLSSLLSFFRRIRRDLQFSRIFLCDFFATTAYLAATAFLIEVAAAPGNAVVEMALPGASIVALHVFKIFMVVFLEHRGGDAREFMGSKNLVVDGFYKYSRNPVYLVSVAQSAIWSLLLLRGGLASSAAPIVIAAAITIPIGHFLGIDLLVIPNEEAALKQAHPEAFADYSRRVNRWFGWSRAA